MSLDLILQPGFEAYSRGDYATASRAWQDEASSQDPETAILLSCLACIATAAQDPQAPCASDEHLELLSRRTMGLDVGFLRQ